MLADCPPDAHVKDGTPCGNSTTSGTQCASGQCTNRDMQCEARGGSMGITSHCPLSLAGDPCQEFQCKDPDNSLSCIFLSGSFIDGTRMRFGTQNAVVESARATMDFINLLTYIATIWLFPSQSLSLSRW